MPPAGRGVPLTLTRTGSRIYEGLIRAAGERDAVFRSCLTKHESQAFDRVLAKLAGRARELIQGEKRK